MDIYYLGAGASYGTLPLMSSMREYLENYMVKINNHEYMSSEPRKIAKELRMNLSQILEKLPEYRTIDTYVKELSDSPLEYEKTKNTLTTAFYFWEYTKSANAKYQSLFANYIHKYPENKAPSLKRPLHIISWNYDNEVERSLAKYFVDKNFTRLYKDLLYSHHSDLGDKNKALVHLYKLNGSSSFITNEGHGPKFFEQLEDDSAMLKSLDLYQNLKSKNYTGLMRFSWDEYEEKSSLMKGLKEVLGACKQLVIIGYSFPSFNTDADAELLRSLNQFARITIQCGDDNEKVKSRLIRMLSLDSNDEKRIYLDESKDDFSIPIPSNSPTDPVWS